LKNYKYVLIILFTLVAELCLAEAVEKPYEREMSIWEEQMIHTGHSLFAAYYPEGYGMLMMALSPLPLGMKYPEYKENTDVIFFSGLFSIGLYNATELRKEKYSKNDVFLRNFVLGNILMGGMKLLKIDSKIIPSGLSLSPEVEGLRIVYDIKF